MTPSSLPKFTLLYINYGLFQARLHVLEECPFEAIVSLVQKSLSPPLFVKVQKRTSSGTQLEPHVVLK